MTTTTKTITTPTDQTTDGYYAVYYPETSEVVIYSGNDVWVGTGRWNGYQIEECTTDLGGKAYEELDSAIHEAIETDNNMSTNTTNTVRHGMYAITQSGRDAASLVEATCPNEALAVARAVFDRNEFGAMFGLTPDHDSRPSAARFVRTVAAEAARVAALPYD